MSEDLVRRGGGGGGRIIYLCCNSAAFTSVCDKNSSLSFFEFTKWKHDGNDVVIGEAVVEDRWRPSLRLGKALRIVVAFLLVAVGCEARFRLLLQSDFCRTSLVVVLLYRRSTSIVYVVYSYRKLAESKFFAGGDLAKMAARGQ